MQNQVRKNEPVWDKANSTYMRVIYLKNGYTLMGYSKKCFRNERKDKIDLLTNWILRDLKSGYLNEKTARPGITPTERIEYFLYRNQSYEPVISLYYSFPEWTNTRWMDQKKFFVFIHRFYDMLRKNVSVPEIVNALEVRTRAQSQDLLDYSRPRFSTIPDLNAYIKKLKEDSDLSDEAIEHFYREYKQKYFNKL